MEVITEGKEWVIKDTEVIELIGHGELSRCRQNHDIVEVKSILCHVK